MLNNAKKNIQFYFSKNYSFKETIHIFLRFIHSKNYSNRKKYLRKYSLKIIDNYSFQKVSHLEKNGNYSFQKLFN